VVGFNGDNPDEVYLLTLNEIKSGTKLFITDNGYIFFSFLFIQDVIEKSFYFQCSFYL